MSRLASVLPALILVALVVADFALGQAGGGSSDYGGGGGSGGGGFGGGGDDFGGGSSGGEGTDDPIGFLIMLAGFLLFATVFFVLHGRKVGWGNSVLSAVHRRRPRERARQVELAAVEAAADDERFLPERVRRAAEALFRDVQSAWDARDRARLATLLGDDLLVEWERRLDDFDRKGWHNRAEVLGDVQIDYVGLTNREGTGDDQVIVLIEATLRAYVDASGGRKILRKGESDDTIRLSQYWTLGLRDGRWILLSIEERSEGEHHLAEPIVGSPWSDTERLRDETVMETAAADGLPAGFKPADVADLDFDGDARAAALDLSLADARFAPDVLEAAARQVVEAWAEAVDGDDTALAQLASEQAVRQLLYEGDETERTRVVVRGPRVRRITILALDATADPATMTIEVQLGGRRYVQDRDTAAVVSGSKSEAAVFTDRWTLSLDGPERRPWQIAAVGNGKSSSREPAGGRTISPGAASS